MKTLKQLIATVVPVVMLLSLKESSGLPLGGSKSSSGSTGIQTSEADTNVLYPSLLTSFLNKLAKELGY